MCDLVCFFYVFLTQHFDPLTLTYYSSMEIWKDPTSLPCSHTFCTTCITQSLRNKYECPLCKRHLTRRELNKMTVLRNVADEFEKLRDKLEEIQAKLRGSTIGEASMDLIVPSPSISCAPTPIRPRTDQELDEMYDKVEKPKNSNASSSMSGLPVQEEEQHSITEGDADTESPDSVDPITPLQQSRRRRKKRSDSASSAIVSGGETNGSSSNNISPSPTFSSGSRRVKRRSSNETPGSRSSLHRTPSSVMSVSDSDKENEDSSSRISTRRMREGILAVQNSDSEYDMETCVLELERKEQNVQAIERAMKDISNRGVTALSFEEHPILESALLYKNQELATTPKPTITHTSSSTGSSSSTSKKGKAAASSSKKPQSSRKRKTRSEDSDFVPDSSEVKRKTRTIRKRKRIVYKESSDAETEDNFEDEEEQEQKSFVLCATGLTPEELSKMKDMGKVLKARVVEKISTQVTHVIAGSNKENRSKRTLKFASGVICGAWIVGYQWVKQCLEYKRFVEEAPFEISGDMYGLGAPKKGREARENEASALFSDMTVYVLGDYDDGKHPSQLELINLCRWGGATAYKSPPKKNISEKKNTFVVVDKLQNEEYLKRIESVSGLKPVYFTWLLECVSHYKVLHPDKYYAA